MMMMIYDDDNDIISDNVGDDDNDVDGGADDNGGDIKITEQSYIILTCNIINKQFDHVDVSRHLKYK